MSHSLDSILISRINLEEVRRILVDYVNDYGPCDHNVNICACGVKHSIKTISIALGEVCGQCYDEGLVSVKIDGGGYEDIKCPNEFHKRGLITVSLSLDEFCKTDKAKQNEKSWDNAMPDKGEIINNKAIEEFLENEDED